MVDCSDRAISGVLRLQDRIARARAYMATGRPDAALEALVGAISQLYQYKDFFDQEDEIKLPGGTKKGKQFDIIKNYLIQEYKSEKNVQDLYHKLLLYCPKNGPNCKVSPNDFAMLESALNDIILKNLKACGLKTQGKGGKSSGGGSKGESSSGEGGEEEVTLVTEELSRRVAEAIRE